MPAITRLSSNGRQPQLEGMFKKVRLPARSRFGGGRSSKAAAFLARGAYIRYVSTAKGRERRWRHFSTFPRKICPATKRRVTMELLEIVEAYTKGMSAVQCALERLKAARDK